MSRLNIKSLFGAQDMTVGKPLTAIIKFSVPLLIGNIAQLLYSTVDSIIVGRYVGDLALAAVGTASTATNLFLILFMAIGTGITIMVAQYFGAKEYDKLSYSVGNALTLIIFASVFIMAVATPLTRPILRLISTPENYFDMAALYCVILFLGAAGNGFYNILSGVLRGLGESVYPLLVLIGTTVLNIILDIVFVAVIKMGVAGAALATIICQLLSSAACLWKLVIMKDIVNLHWSSMKIRKFYMGRIISLGIPSGIQQGVTGIAFMFVQNLINSMGYLVAACTTAVMRVDAFAILPSFAFNTAASTFTGQNIGAKKLDRVKSGNRSLLIFGLIVSAVLVAAIILLRRPMLGLFTETPEVIEMGSRFLCIMAAGYVIIAVSAVLSGTIRGAGDTVAPMWISLITNVIIRIPFTYLIAYLTRSDIYPAGNPDTIYIGMLVAFAINSTATFVYYLKGKWKERAIV